jgi:hypothetical protein
MNAVRCQIRFSRNFTSFRFTDTDAYIQVLRNIRARIRKTITGVKQCVSGALFGNAFIACGCSQEQPLRTIGKHSWLVNSHQTCFKAAEASEFKTKREDLRRT